MTEGEAGSGWAQVTAGTTALPPDGVHEFRTAELRGSALPGAPAAERLRVWQVYWIGGRFITGDIEATVQLALDRLRGRGDDAAVLLLYTPLEPDRAGAAAAADATLGRFVAVQFNPLAAALEAVRRQRAAPARPPSDPLSAGTSS